MSQHTIYSFALIGMQKNHFKYIQCHYMATQTRHCMIEELCDVVTFNSFLLNNLIYVRKVIRTVNHHTICQENHNDCDGQILTCPTAEIINNYPLDQKWINHSILLSITLGQIQPPACLVNKVLLIHSYSYSSTYCLWLLESYNDRIE